MDGTLEFALVESIAAALFMAGCALVHRLLQRFSDSSPYRFQDRFQENAGSIPPASLPQLSSRGVSSALSSFSAALPIEFEIVEFEIVEFETIEFEAPGEVLDPSSKSPTLLTTSPTIHISEALIPSRYRSNRYIHLH